MRMLVGLLIGVTLGVLLARKRGDRLRRAASEQVTRATAAARDAARTVGLGTAVTAPTPGERPAEQEFPGA